MTIALPKRLNVPLPISMMNDTYVGADGREVSGKVITYCVNNFAAVLEITNKAIHAGYSQLCPHENLSRGGSIWTICDDFDMKSADDRGGFKPNSEIAKLDNLQDEVSALLDQFDKPLPPKNAEQTVKDLINSGVVNIDISIIERLLVEVANSRNAK